MTPFKEALHHQIHDRRYVVKSPMLDIEMTEKPCNFTMDTQNEHSIKAILGTKFICRDGEVEYMKKQTYHQIMHFVYGDIEEDLYELMKTVYESGDLKGIEVIQKVKHSLPMMFNLNNKLK